MRKTYPPKNIVNAGKKSDYKAMFRKVDDITDPKKHSFMTYYEEPKMTSNENAGRTKRKNTDIE